MIATTFPLSISTFLDWLQMLLLASMMFFRYGMPRANIMRTAHNSGLELSFWTGSFPQLLDPSVIGLVLTFAGNNLEHSNNILPFKP